jgi:cobalt-zinc-cadmium resistance protein CzcA
VAATQYDLETSYRAALQRVVAYRAALDDFEQNTNPVVVQTLQIADNQLKNGAINYVEWTLSATQAFAIRMEYVDLLQQYHQALVALEYFVY